MHWQAANHRAVILQGPASAKIWEENPIAAAFSRPGMSKVRLPAETINKRSSILLKGTSEVCQALEEIPGHAGGYAPEFAGQLVEGAEVYLSRLWPAQAAPTEAIRSLFPVDQEEQDHKKEERRVPEETFMTPEDEVEATWSEEEIHEGVREETVRRVPRQVRREVGKISLRPRAPEQDYVSAYDEARRRIPGGDGLCQSVAVPSLR